MATMRDVARAAGVSVSTVSHVVNRTRLVNEQTRDRVERAIAETGWQHNALARSLATGGGTGSIGLAVTGISNEYIADLHRAIEQYLAERGLTVLMTETHDDPVREQAAVATLMSRQVDGIILALGPEPDPWVMETLRSGDIPVVLVDRAVDVDRDFVGSENVEPIAELTSHLIGHGHRRVAMIAARRGVTTSAEREEGYQVALQRAGLPFDPDLLIYGDSSELGAADAVERLLQLRNPPTAVVSANNQMTIGVLRRLRDLGVRVPDQLALGSFDDFNWADLLAPPLTAVAQPWTRMGATAAELILRRIADASAPVQQVRLRPVLNVRQTCGCPPDAVAGPAHPPRTRRSPSTRKRSRTESAA